MTISCAEGTIVFEEIYDGPLVEHSYSPFVNKEKKDSTVFLHRFCFADKWYLCSKEGFFPIAVEHNNGLFKIAVYNPFSVANKEGLTHSLRAVITQTKAFSDGFHYEVRIEELPSLPFLVAIFSLPLVMRGKISAMNPHGLIQT